MVRALKRGSKPVYRHVTGRGGTTKALALTDALGTLVCFELQPGHRYDTVGVAPLIHGIEFGGLLADKAFDNHWITEDLNERGAAICISQRPQREAPLAIDNELYKAHHLIEHIFGKLKAVKRITMRNDKTGESFCAIIYAAASFINAR